MKHLPDVILADCLICLSFERYRKLFCAVSRSLRVSFDFKEAANFLCVWTLYSVRRARYVRFRATRAKQLVLSGGVSHGLYVSREL